MADSFFGFDTSVSNLNDDEGGGGEGSEEEYDALNDETFGNADEYDWEMQHEQLSEQIESSRRIRSSFDDSHSQLEASLSQLVLDDTDTPHHSTLNTSNVWKNDSGSFGLAPTPVSALKNVCTVEELERQLRQSQNQNVPQMNHNFFQPRFPPVILQRPPGMQGPVPLPFAPQNPMMNNQMGQNINKMTQLTNMLPQSPMPNSIGQMNPNMQMSQLSMQNNQYMTNTNQMNSYPSSHPNLNIGQGQMNHLNQPGQINHLNQPGQMGQLNQPGQMGQMNQPGQMGQMNQPGQMGQMNQPGQMGQMNQPGQMGQMNQSQMGQMNQSQMNQMPNQMVANGNQYGPGIGQYPHMMGQPRMIPPPGLNMPPRQNFNQNMGFNANFRAPTKLEQQQQPMNNQFTQQQQMMKNSPPNQKSQPSGQQQSQTKHQKNRVVYNSNQNRMNAPDMTSQNLVQLIQNSHPMLQQTYNSIYHNANHHPMLNRNGQFSNQVNSNVYGPRQNGFFNNNGGNSHENMNGTESPVETTDEYAGLMTQREKQWLINIQMIQLNTGTPYIDDFYYTVFLERKARKEKEGVKEAHKANQQNHPFYSGNVQKQERERHNSGRHNSQSEDVTPRTYVPTQFENSLGRLQCLSVTAPRKIIDVELVEGGGQGGGQSRAPSVASTLNTEAPREMRRTKQILLDIESMYLVLLRLEELNEPLAISNALILKEREEKQKLAEAQASAAGNILLRDIEAVHRRHKQDKSDSDKRQVVSVTGQTAPSGTKNLLDEKKEELTARILHSLLQDDRARHCLMVRKGRTFLARFLSRCCGVSACSESARRVSALWARVLRAAPASQRRHGDVLGALLPAYEGMLETTPGWSAVLDSCQALAEAFDPARTPHALCSTLIMSCVSAMCARAMQLSDVSTGGTTTTTTTTIAAERQWGKFLRSLGRALRRVSAEHSEDSRGQCARPVRLLNADRLRAHVRQLVVRAPPEILPRGTPDLGPGELAQLLVVALC